MFSERYEDQVLYRDAITRGQQELPPPIGHNNGPALADWFVPSCPQVQDAGSERFCPECGRWGCPRAPQDAPAPVVNPKELAGAKKPATWSVMPRWIVLLVGRVMSVGAAKYGAFNYRDSSISASVYQDALERHLTLWFDGEDDDAETGVSHLASAIASCALLLDAQASGKLNDDRQKTGHARKHLDALEALLKTNPLPERKLA